MNREGLTIGEILDRVEERRITPEEGYRLIEELGGVNMDSGLSGANIKPPESIYFRSAWEKSMYNEKDAKGQVIDDLVIFDTDVEFFRVIRQKAANSHRISLVLIGETFGKKEDGIYHINPSISEDYEKLTEDLTEQGIVPSHIIHRWSNSSLEHESLPLKDILERSIYSVFFLVKALMKKKLSNSIILYTYPVQENTDGDLGKMQPYHAAVSGFAKTLFMENPSFILKTIGICATSSGVQGEAAWAMGLLMNEFNASMPRELEIRLEDNVRYLRRLEEIKVIQGEHLLFRYRGVYLIAGGLGGLGFIFAKYLSGKLKARLVLTGRSSLNPESESKIRELESLGAEVVYMEGDIARREDVEKIADRVKALFNEINGVIHCAGVYRDGFIIRKTREDMEPVLAPKVYGAVNLDEVFEKENMDFFLLCSSMAGVTGKVGQCDYSYGNSFMDNYAKMRETLKNAGRRSGKSVSVNWPLWEEGGMKLSKDEQDMMNEQAGMEALPTTEGIKALEASLTGSSHQMMVLYGSRDKIREYFSRNFFSGKEDAKPSAASVDTEIIRQKTEELLKGILAEEVGMSEESIDVNTNFEEYGIDSIIINQFNVHVEKKLGSLPKTLLFEYRNLRDMANFVANNYREQVVSNLGLGVKESQGGGDKTEPSVDLQWKTLKSLGESSRGKVNAQYGTPQESDADKGDIAIIGVSGRYPLADNLQEFWANMKNGRDCVTEIPVSRWDYRLYYDPETEKIKEGKMYCKWGGFINHIDTFDPLFFNISPREAEIMDPQERLFLETSWGALEDAGYTKSLLKRYAHGDIGPNVGVFVGVTSNTYQLLGAEQWGMGNRVITASTPWSVANRVSYLLNLSGPSVPVDTACSSALVSIHIACESLKKGECRMAIAGGVNLYMHPSKYVSMCQIKMLSRKGRCHSFGAEGDGFVPAEGVGAILLKPLKEAIDDGDRIYGVIKGTAINHGGKTSGYSVPNPNAQAEVIFEALKKSGISARTVSYIEAHGTGTALGDPIEIAGLTKAFSQYTLDKQFCSIGSVKSNVGHQESAAGIAGITKILLMMQHKMHVPSLHSKVLNPNIKFEDSPFVVQQELEEWKAPVVVENGVSRKYPRRAGISSFGAGGANVHIVMEEYKGPAGKSLNAQKETYMVVLSAKNKERLLEYAGNMADFLEIKAREFLNGSSITRSISESVIEQVKNFSRSNEIISKDTIIKYSEAFEALGKFETLMALKAFNNLGVLKNSAEKWNKETLKQTAGIISSYDKLYETLLELLNKAGFIKILKREIITSKKLEDQNLQETLNNLERQKNELTRDFPEITAHIGLIWKCLRAYPEVLTGRMNAMDVMFPGGSVELVEKIYKGSEIVDYYNKLVAYTVKSYVKRRLEENSHAVIQIVEVGAGTGGTSAFVLKELKEFAGSIRYFYTDISAGFTQYGKKQYGRDYGFVQFKTLDIENLTETQGFQPGTIDLAFGTNVIHATKSIDNTLGNIRKLLKKNGLVIINEITQVLSFSNLTFGLTDGWWLYRDDEYRIKNSPLLTAEMWLKALENNGFSNAASVGLPDREAEQSGQNLIIGLNKDVQEIGISAMEASYLAEIEFTLKEHREAFDERLALLASRMDDAVEKLRRYSKGEKNISDLYTGNVKGVPEKSLTTDLGTADLMGEGAMKFDDYERIARLWTTSGETGFRAPRQDTYPGLATLPTYPFARDRYWIADKRNAEGLKTAEKSKLRLHPMIDSNVSTLEGLSFEKEIGQEEFFLNGSKIGGKMSIPGIIYLEMSRAAGELANKKSRVRGLKNVIWAKPHIFNRDSEKLEISICAQRSKVEFEIACAGKESPGAVYCQGEIVYGEEKLLESVDDYMDIEQIQKRCMISANRDEFYGTIQARDMKYGKDMQVIHQTMMNENEALSVMKLPESLTSGAAEFALHPCMLIGAIQTCMVLTSIKKIEEGVLYFPYSLKEINILAPIPEECLAYVSCEEFNNAGGNIRFNIWLMDLSGKVCACMTDYMERKSIKYRGNDNDILN